MKKKNNSPELIAKQGKRKKKQILIFSEEIDSTIGGTAVGMAFLTISLFLTLYRGYIINETVTAVFVWLTLLVGMPILLACLFSKTRYDGRCAIQEHKINSNYLGWCAFLIILLTIYHIYLNLRWLNWLSALLMFILAFIIWQELLFYVCAKRGECNKMRDIVPVTNLEMNSKPSSIWNILSVISFVATLLGLGVGVLQLIFTFK